MPINEQEVSRVKTAIERFQFSERGDVLLMTSPLCWKELPSLSLHLLQAACRREGIITHVLYLNLLYSVAIGQSLHGKIARDGEDLLLEERLFAPAAFNHSAVAGCMDKFLDPNWMPDHRWKISPNMANQVPEIAAPFREWIGTIDWEHLESLTTHWIQSTAQCIASMGYRIVGYSTTLGGLVSAVALFNNIKKTNAEVITVLGGALCDGEMAEGILSLKAGIDYVFSGEGEVMFPEFVKKVMAGQLPKGKIIYSEPVADLDASPVPDYQDYLDQLKKLPLHHPPPNHSEIIYETSRGCWYGKCAFCGLKGQNNVYRTKSPDKVLNDLKKLVTQSRIHTISMTDHSIPLHYFDTLLPRISRVIPSVKIGYEMKSDLRLEQVIALKKSGAKEIRTGIESFSPSLLRRMQKGVTVRENIGLLRYARSSQLSISWLLLFGFPGDETQEYEEILRLLPLIHHLNPPLQIFSLRICRFSPYYKSPEAFGIFNLRPAEIHKDIFPPHVDLDKIAYYFAGDFRSQSYENPGIIIALVKEVQAWQKAWAAYRMVPLELMLPILHVTQKSENEYVLEDTRGLPGRPKRSVLNREQASILLVPRPQDSSDDYQWAVDAQLGVLMDSWVIPLATAKPELLLEFEQDYREER